MFIKIENYIKNEPLIVNVDRIISIEPHYSEVFERCFYELHLVDSYVYVLSEEQYKCLCDILTKRL